MTLPLRSKLLPLVGSILGYEHHVVQHSGPMCGPILGCLPQMIYLVVCKRSCWQEGIHQASGEYKRNTSTLSPCSSSPITITYTTLMTFSSDHGPPEPIQSLPLHLHWQEKRTRLPLEFTPPFHVTQRVSFLVSTVRFLLIVDFVGSLLLHPLF